MKLLANLLCENEWVCAFSITFNKHTRKKNITEKKYEQEETENNLIKFICFPIVRFHFSFYVFELVLLSSLTAVLIRKYGRKKKNTSVLPVIFSFDVMFFLHLFPHLLFALSFRLVVRNKKTNFNNINVYFSVCSRKIVVCLCTFWTFTKLFA